MKNRPPLHVPGGIKELMVWKDRIHYTVAN